MSMEENNMVSDMDHFLADLKTFIEGNSITSNQFLAMSKKAVETEVVNPEHRQQIANYMANLWIKFKEEFKDDLVNHIGQAFVELEIPDELIQLENDQSSVQEKWHQIGKLLEK